MPFPEPYAIASADIIRDGGTFILLYLDRSGAQHLVKVPVRLNANFERLGYSEPSVRSDATGEVSRMTWEEAARLADQLAPLIGDGVGMGGPSRARQAVELLSLGGQLPIGA